MKDDQWFEPGDKVMRVVRGPVLDPLTDFGITLSVSWCGRMKGDFNRVFFTGIPSSTGYGHRAKNFRKVEEIQLCVRAAKKNPKELEVEVLSPTKTTSLWNGTAPSLRLPYRP